MFDTLTNANKETQQGMKVWYVYEAKFYVIQHELTAVYHLTRHITKQYQYVGLTEAAAKSGAAAKTTQYTKQTRGWFFSPEDPQGPFIPRDYTRVVAQVASQHTAGHMWSVQINVNQTDELWTTALPSNLKSAFDAVWPITDADYDE